MSLSCNCISMYLYVVLSLTLKVRGSWTAKLHNLILQTGDIDARIEGPYGAPAQHFSKFSTVVLFGAGIGVTPFASILKHLVHKSETKPDYAVKKVYFYWIARDHSHFEWFHNLLTSKIFPFFPELIFLRIG